MSALLFQKRVNELSQLFPGSVHLARMQQQAASIQGASRQDALIAIWPQTPWALADEGFVFGCMPSGASAILPKSSMNGMTLCVGMPGSGKTSLMSLIAMQAASLGIGTSFITHKDSGSATHGLAQLSANNAALDLYPPDGATKSDYFAHLLGALENVYFLNYGSHLILRELDSLEKPCCWSQILHALEQRRFKDARQAGYQQAAMSALRRLTANDGGLFSTAQGLSWDKRFQIPHEVNLFGISPDQIRYYLSIILWSYLRWTGARRLSDRTLTHLILVDDARLIFRERNQPTADVILHNIDVSNAGGGGLTICSQNCHAIDVAYLQSASVVVLIGPQTPEDVGKMRARMQLSSNQSQYLITQPQYHAVLHVRGAEPIPIKLLDPLTFTPKNIGDLSQHRTRLMLDGYHPKLWEPPAEDKHEEKGSTSTAAKPTDKDAQSETVPATYVAAIATLLKSPWMLQSEWKKAAGLSTKDITQMMTHCLIKRYALGRTVFFETTEHTAKVCKLHLPRLPGVGGYKHRWLVARIKAYHEKQGSKGRTEVTLGTQRIDLVVESQDGSKTAYEVMLSDSNLSETINGLLAFDGARIIITDSKSATKAAKDQGITVRSVAQAIRTWTP